MPDLSVVSHDGLQIAARDLGGSGPDVILLHGAMRNLEDWSMVLRHLDGVRVVTIDQRFHGHSGVPEALSPSDPVRDIEAVVDALGITNPFVAGHSMGGMNALLYGVESRKCRGVLNIDGYDFRQPELYDELPDDEVKAFLDEFAMRAPSFVARGDDGDAAWREQQIEVLTGMDAAWGVDPEQTAAVLNRSFPKTGEDRWERRPPSSFWQLATGETADVLGLLRRASGPVTFLGCTKPMMPLPEGTDYFAIARRGLVRHITAIGEVNPNVRVKTIDATHGVIYERPEEIAKLITSLASV